MTALDATSYPITATPVALTPTVPSLNTAGAATDGTSSDGAITFDDVLDIVNPLQHIPVVSTLYRAITGDSIKTFPKIAGDTLYGGWMGFAGSIADTIFQKVTGKDFGDTALAMVENVFSPDSPAPTGVADNSATVPDATSAPVAPVQTASLAPLDTTATPVASNAPALPAPVTPASLDTIVVPGQAALLSALSRSGVAPDTALRAVQAYRSTVAVTDAAAALPQPALRSSIVQ